MKTTVLAAAFAFLAVPALAEDATCKVQGMHCKGCQEMVEGKVCDDKKYSTCAIRIVDEKKQVGEIHLITKDPKAAIDRKALAQMIEDSGYKLDGCSTGAGKTPPSKGT